MLQFPGMNPYLEGYLFQDLHSALASRIRAVLTPLLRSRYAARLEVSNIQRANGRSPLQKIVVYPGETCCKAELRHLRGSNLDPTG